MQAGLLFQAGSLDLGGSEHLLVPPQIPGTPCHHYALSKPPQQDAEPRPTLENHRLTLWNE
jgi:hypothetical protein